ncbi:MAG: response regulator, partial [Pseudomonadota bacterium]
MPVKVLIIDDVATNRIVLKVKLAAASYEVHQACSGEEGVKIAEREKPDIYVVNADLEGESSVDVIKRLAALSVGQQANTIALSEKDCAENRLDLLRAGAFDVLTKQLCESLFLARMRSLSRGLHDRKDLALTTDTADALGFDEPTRPFTMRGRICALNAQIPQLRTSLQSLVANCTHDVEFCEPGSGSQKEAPRNIGTPDVVLVPIDGDADQAGLTHLAELRLTDPTRHARLIAVLSDTNTALAGRALDLGADDVVGFQANTVEAEIRISRQLHGKRTEDSLRQRLQNSLEAAVTDPLTGLYNRRYALSALGKMADSLMRQGGCFAVMVADL